MDDNRPELKSEMEEPCKKPYTRPLLQHKVHLRDITLAPTPGGKESDGAAGFTTETEKGGGIDPLGNSTDSSGTDKIFKSDIFGG